MLSDLSDKIKHAKESYAGMVLQKSQFQRNVSYYLTLSTRSKQIKMSGIKPVDFKRSITNYEN